VTIRRRDSSPRPFEKPPLKVFSTTLWTYPSQHYDSSNTPRGTTAMQGDARYEGATPSWVIWQVLQRYTRPGDTVLDPMVGSGTTIDVCADLGRQPLAFDLAPSRPDIKQADARSIPLPNTSADFVFIDPPYSTHIDYSTDPRCIGKLDSGGIDQGKAYFKAMDQVIAEIDRVLKPGRYMSLYVSDSWRKRKKGDPGSGTGEFMPIGFELFARLQSRFKPVDVISVIRGNQKLERGPWHDAAVEGNYFLRGFNYLFIMHKTKSRG